MNDKKLKIKWLSHAVAGFLVMGFGLSLIGDAVAIKMNGVDFWEWFIYGSLSLAVFFTGLSIFGEAVVFKTLIGNSKRKNKGS